MKIVVTGEIGSGKSTVVRAAMATLGWEKPGGFFTRWGEGGRGGPVVQMETWDGRSVLFARRVAEPAEAGRLPYRLEAAVVDRVRASLETNGRGGPVVVDELGLIELESEAFGTAMAELFARPGDVLAVIQRRALSPWRERLGEGVPDRVLSVEPNTREGLSAEIAGMFRR